MEVTVERALELIYEHTTVTSLKILPLENALGHTLAEEIIASHNLPPYNNSAMDGYAVKVEDAGKRVRIKETIFAGDDSDTELNTGEAVKIMTGARVPLTAECVVPIEETQTCQEKVNSDAREGDVGYGVLLPKNLTANRHIRFSGEDIKKGDLLLERGDIIDAHKITLLASQGISHIKVHKRPRVALFSSGSELKMHFEELQAHQLYNTNTPTLLARSQELGCEVEFIGTPRDTLEEIQEHIKSALECDLIITIGGVSVGDADFTKEAFGAFGYEIYFDKVEIKPGKPTTFGKIGNTYILNLPGNPLAAALNFELFGRSIIYALGGAKSRFLNAISAKMSQELHLKKGKRALIPGFYDGEFFRPCELYAPGMISPLSFANGFIMVDEECSLLAENANVKVISTKFDFTSASFKSLLST